MSEMDHTHRAVVEEVYRLVQLAVAGELDAVDAARLEALVVNDAVARESYTSCILDTVVLRDLGANRLLREEFATGIRSEQSASPPAIVPVGEAIDLACVGSPLDTDLPLGRASGFSCGAIWSFRFAALFACALVVAGFGLAILSWPSPGQAPEVAKQRTVDFAPGRVNSVRLDSGITTLSLDKIGTVIVEGPSDFELIGPKRARLTKGRIRMRVTSEEGRGFVVETPHGNVTDLGTEFALDVPEKGKTELVVFDGAVDLEVERVANSAVFAQTQRLVRGEGVTIDGLGQLDRIMSVITGKRATFQPRRDSVASKKDCVIVDVSDNLRTEDTKMFYEIVPGSLQEDVLAYVDRPEHEWNGFTESGMPKYLIGADYVKAFSSDKMNRKFELYVTIGRPAKLYVFFDDRVPRPDWLVENFRNTGDAIGLDSGPFTNPVRGTTYKFRCGVGPGKEIDARLSVWERIVAQPGRITLGANGGLNNWSTMYGIAAVPHAPD